MRFPLIGILRHPSSLHERAASFRTTADAPGCDQETRLLTLAARQRRGTVSAPTNHRVHATARLQAAARRRSHVPAANTLSTPDANEEEVGYKIMQLDNLWRMQSAVDD